MQDRETQRLAALARYHLLDTPREPTFDEIADLAARLCDTPIAVVNLIGDGRQFFKAEVGLGVRETPLETSFCAMAILEQDFLLVPDATQDSRFEDNPLVTGEPHLRFYAGALLKTDDGLPIGTLCVLDYRPRQLTVLQQDALRVLARQAMAQIELRHALDERNRQLEAARASEERLRLVLDSARDYAILTTDEDGRITSWSAGAEAAFEWSRDAAIGRPLADLFMPEDRAAGVPEKELATAAKEGRALDVRWHLRADGSRVFMNGTTHPYVEEGEPPVRGFLKIARNETAQRRQTEELARTRIELVGSEARFRALIDVSAAAVWTTDAAGHMVEHSPSWAEFTGQSFEQAGGSGWLAAIHPDDRAEARVNWQSAVLTCNAFDTEFRLAHRASGGFRWTRVRATPLVDEGGGIIGWVGMNTDIDDHKRNVQMIAESEARFRNMADHAPVMMWVTDPDGACTYLNRSWYDFTGQTEQEALGLGWLDATHPDDRAMAEQTFITANATRSPFRVEYRLRRRDGAYRWSIDAASPRFDADGAYLGYVGSVIDIDERRDAERRIRESEEQLRLATEAADIGLWDVDLDSNTLFWPPRVRAMFGVSADVPVTLQDFYDGLHPDDLESTSIAFASAADPATRSVYDVEFRTIGRDDGVVRWIAAKGRGIFDQQGVCHRVLGTAIDVTKRRTTEQALKELNETLEQRIAEEVAQRARAEEQLRQAQKMEAVGQLTGGIAHDFNNMLTGVIGSLDLIQRNIAAGKFDRVDRYIDAASISAQRAAALTARLLAFGRRQSLDLQPLDVNVLVRGLEDMLQRTLGEQVEMQTHLDPTLWASCSDVNQLESALLNLCINARDAMPNGGRLTIETGNTTLDERYAGQHDELAAGDYVVLSVSDSGMGMAPATIDRVFEPFFTTKPIGQGTGLGLSMIYGFARQSGGHVAIYSEIGRGTTVRLYVPRYRGEVDAGTAPISETPRGSGETVMIVEDDPAVRLIVLEVLEELGYAAIEAVDGATALPILRSDRKIDLLVSDVGLPGMNGRHLAEIARQGRPGLRILFITGYAENAAVRSGFLDQGMEMLTKPFAVEALAVKIQDMLRN